MPIWRGRFINREVQQIKDPNTLWMKFDNKIYMSMFMCTHILYYMQCKTLQIGAQICIEPYHQLRKYYFQSRYHIGKQINVSQISIEYWSYNTKTYRSPWHLECIVIFLLRGGWTQNIKNQEMTPMDVQYLTSQFYAVLRLFANLPYGLMAQSISHMILGSNPPPPPTSCKK